MNFKQVKETENQFAQTGFNGTFTLSEPQILPLKNEPNLALNLVKCTRVEEKNPYFFKEQFDKKQIVLHFTMGHVKGDLLTLTGESDDPNRSHVSVPYVVAKDGKVYRLFGSDFWAYHIGRNKLGLNKDFSRRTIGIELSNYGPLKLGENNHLLTDYSTPEKPDIYCHLDDTEAYIKLDTPFRDYTYYANYTDAQYDSLIVLLRYLTTAWGIQKAFLPEAIRHTTTEKTVNFDGIVSHINYRDDKTDIGPAFDWSRVEAGVLAPFYESTQHQLVASRDLDSPESAATIPSERSLDKPSWYRKKAIVSETLPEPDF
jgi:N-acetylmuramoyl-L-alanine amidase